MVKKETSDSIKFHINGVEHSVGPGSKVAPKTALVDYIRDVANLKGTKVMCREGGCGACLVSVKVVDTHTGSEIIKSVNSCLTPVLSCDGWDITTVEQLGNRHEGYHVIQNRLVNFHGTQCGYCTPGMVVNMYSLLEGKKTLEMADVEKGLDGNICRCTGYRPILDAFKTLASDASDDLKKKCADIEDCATCPLKRQSGVSCDGKVRAQVSTSHDITLTNGDKWVTAKTLDEALTAAAKCSAANGSVRFVAGNTSTGIFKNEGPFQTFIDVNGIPELKMIKVDNQGIEFGGGTTLTQLISLLKENSNKVGLEYGERVASHLERVANTSVRNTGTIAGNLMIKHKNIGFPSDVFVIMEALGATITLASATCSNTILGKEKVRINTLKPIGMAEFLKTDMNLKLVLSIRLPKREGYHYRSFKITRRYQNAHAYVNAALLLKVDKAAGFKVTEKPRLVYGGISGSFIHAAGAEDILNGKSLSDVNTLKAAFEALDKEVKPEDGPLESSKEYRIRLVKTLLYKTILEIVGEKVGSNLKSGIDDLVRTLTTAKQVFDDGKDEVALYKAIPKIEAGIQVSGEAEYTGDIPFRPDELFGAYVKSTVGSADLVEVDASEALKIPGVVRFITAKDIPGENNALKFNFFPPVMVEPIFAVDKIYYHGQSLGLILATSRDLAFHATKLVKVKYANEEKPVVRLEAAVEKAKADGSFFKQTFGKHSTKPNDNVKVVHSVKGSFRTGSQYHGYMEPQTVVCHPREDGIDVHISTQDMDMVQNHVASSLGIPSNGVNVQVRRVGGGFGGKANNSYTIAAACAVATWVTNRPVRVVLDMETNMSMLGKRHPYHIPYEVGFDENGRIGSLKADIISDTGYTPNNATNFAALLHIQNVYKALGWEVDTHFVKTNTAANTFCRAPGSLQSCGAIEWIMDHVATHLKKDPLQIREANLLETGDALLFDMFGPPTYNRENLIPQMIAQMKAETDYEARKVFIEKFNQENRWKKRGMAVVPIRYGIEYFATCYPASVAIYHMDGHVAVCHGGIEMGQGMNTKVLQTVAQALQVPMKNIKVKPSNNFVGANALLTAGSIGSELICYSVVRACEEIRENLRPILEKLENPSWEKLIEEAYNAKVNLTASYTPTAKDDIKGYDVWVLNLAEVEVDVLTGEYKILRTDLYEDTGKSLSPAVDLGQIEGGYIMGQGFWTTEKIIYDEETGKLLTNGTWDYKPPECKDIPEDFRITLLSNSPNPNGVLRSKATGEPSVDSAFAVVLAMRNAIASARKDVGNEEWFEFDESATPEEIARLCLLRDSDLTL